MTKIYKDKKYRGKWIAIKSPQELEVVAYGKTLEEILRKSSKKGIASPWVRQIPKEILPFVGLRFVK